MSFWVCLPLIPAISNLFLIFLVLRSNWRSLLHRIVSLFLLVMAIWAFSVFGLRASPTLEGALSFQRAAVGNGAIGAVLYYHLTVLLTRPSPSARSNRILAIGYILVIAFAGLLPTTLLVP